MTTTYSNNPQGTPEWRAERAGLLTASRFADLTATLKNGSPAASRAAVIATCVVERITGHPDNSVFVNDAMRRGTELEPMARAAYEAHCSVEVVQAGFATSERLHGVGCSVDGLVGDTGIIELKCPWNITKHLDALLTGAHAAEYQAQIQGCLWITGRQWCDAVSFDPRYGDGLHIAVVRVKRNDVIIADIAECCSKANAEIETLIADLRKRLKPQEWGS